MTVWQVRHILSFEEYQSWKLFYLLEPWGWHDREYRTATMLAMLNNVNASKRNQQKRETDFIRDMPKLIDKAYYGELSQEIMREKLLEANIEDRRRMIAQAFGTIAKDVKIDDGSNKN